MAWCTTAVGKTTCGMGERDSEHQQQMLMPLVQGFVLCHSLLLLAHAPHINLIAPVLYVRVHMLAMPCRLASDTPHSLSCSSQSRPFCMRSYGTCTYANGDVYKGKWQKNQKHGDGCYTFSNGNQYTGDWRCDRACGNGICEYANGDR